jgi:hypothetical protein
LANEAKDDGLRLSEGEGLNVLELSIVGQSELSGREAFDGITFFVDHGDGQRDGAGSRGWSRGCRFLIWLLSVRLGRKAGEQDRESRG